MTKEKIVRINAETGEILSTHPFEHLKRWAATQEGITLDFGDHEDDYVVLITKEGEAISDVISGYIQLRLKMKGLSTDLSNPQPVTTGAVKKKLEKER